MTPSNTIVIQPSDDEAADYQAIEDAAEVLSQLGFEPKDAEPGEWLWMQRGDELVEIRIGNEDEPVVILDPDRGDPDQRDNRCVLLSETFTVRLPKTFYDDHCMRDLIAGNIEGTRSRYYVVRMDDVVADELISDAECMLTYAAQGQYGPEMMGLVASARATVIAIQKARLELATKLAS